MTKPDDDLQEILFGEVMDMDMDVKDICIDFLRKMMVRSNFLNKVITKKFPEMKTRNITVIHGKN